MLNGYNDAQMQYRKHANIIPAFKTIHTPRLTKTNSNDIILIKKMSAGQLLNKNLPLVCKMLHILDNCVESVLAALWKNRLFETVIGYHLNVNK